MGTTVSATSLIHAHSGHNDLINRFKNKKIISQQMRTTCHQPLRAFVIGNARVCLLEKILYLKTAH